MFSEQEELVHKYYSKLKVAIPNTRLCGDWVVTDKHLFLIEKIKKKYVIKTVSIVNL